MKTKSIEKTDKPQETSLHKAAVSQHQVNDSSQCLPGTSDIQHAAGNLAIERLFRTGVIQAKLIVGQPGDQYEQEADRIAEQVMRKTRSGIAQSTGTSGSSQMYTKLRSNNESQAEQSIMPTVVNEVLCSSGKPLDEATRALMETHLGHDLSQVRIHTDVKAAKAAQGVSALAYTMGHNIVFGAGQYMQGTQHGQKLLAHELVHVLQQRGSQAHLQRRCGITESSGLHSRNILEEITEGWDCFQPLIEANECLTFRNWIPPTTCRSPNRVGDAGHPRYGDRYIHSRDWDAFGHCWIVCEGTRQCGGRITAILGTGREGVRELQRIREENPYIERFLVDPLEPIIHRHLPRVGEQLGQPRPHDSLTQDLGNQSVGRRLASQGGTCFALCDGAYRSGQLDLSAPTRGCAYCSTDGTVTRDERNPCPTEIAPEASTSETPGPEPPGAGAWSPEAAGSEVPEAWRPEAPRPEVPEAWRPEAPVPEVPEAWRPEAPSPEIPEAWRPEVPSPEQRRRETTIETTTPSDLSCIERTESSPSRGVDLMFGQADHTLSVRHREQIAALVDRWSVRGGREHFFVHGYASVEGRSASNMRLSCNRAISVARELVRLGVPANRISLISHGETTQFSSDTLSLNRRVAICLGAMTSSAICGDIDEFFRRALLIDPGLLSDFVTCACLGLNITELIPGIPADIPDCLCTIYTFLQQVYERGSDGGCWSPFNLSTTDVIALKALAELAGVDCLAELISEELTPLFTSLVGTAEGGLAGTLVGALAGEALGEIIAPILDAIVMVAQNLIIQGTPLPERQLRACVRLISRVASQRPRGWQSGRPLDRWHVLGRTPPTTKPATAQPTWLRRW